MLPDVGIGEIVLIGLVALLVLKPEDIPLLARKAGRLLARAQRWAAGLWPPTAAAWTAEQPEPPKVGKARTPRRAAKPPR